MGQRVAILVDGENISAAHAPRIKSIGARHGSVDIIRTYGNAACNTGWHTAPGYRMVHSGIGKNAADLLLTIDAMEFAQNDAVATFVLASSDGDFTHLAQRLRERGLNVVGVGESKAPEMFRAACSGFEFLDAATLSAKSCATSAGRNGISEMDVKIRDLIAANSVKGSGILITDLSLQMKAQFEIRISTFPEKNWRGYFSVRTHLYDLDPRGPDARVRYRREGFGQTG